MEKILQFVTYLTRGKYAYYREVMPHSLKQEWIKKLARNYGVKTFIETGTYLGEMVEAVSGDFEKIYSIELAEQLYLDAVKKFADRKHIEIIKGDSGEVLKELLAKTNQPILFWLDGHYSMGNTAKGSIDTPILAELENIFAHEIKNHVIAIDDARCFNGTYFYPSQREIVELVRNKAPHYRVLFKNDLILILPR